MDRSYPSLLPVLLFAAVWALANVAFVLVRCIRRRCKRQASASEDAWTAELVSPLHLRVSTTAFNNVITAAASQCTPEHWPHVAWLVDAFYNMGVYAAIASMVLCAGVLVVAALQIGVAMSAKVGFMLPKSSLMVNIPMLEQLTASWMPAVPDIELSSQNSQLSRRHYHQQQQSQPQLQLAASATEPQHVLQPVIPGVTLPAGHLWHYLVALAICAVTHELGHAIAAARARITIRRLGAFVMGIYPGAFVELCQTKLDRASITSRLRVACAGVWHNAMMAACIWLLICSGGLSALFASTGWSRVSDGVAVVDIALHSPLYGQLPLHSTIRRIDDVCLQPQCSNDSFCFNGPQFGSSAIARWTSILTATHNNRNTTSAGFCASIAENADDGLCCEISPQLPLGESPDPELFCFERFQQTYSASAAQPTSPMCFDLRVVLQRTGTDRCQSDHDCDITKLPQQLVGRQKQNRLCVIPKSPYPDSRVLRIYYRVSGSSSDNMLVYAGSPAALWLEVQVSSLVPRVKWLPYNLPSWIETLLQYVLSFSLAFCLLNALPAWNLDGEHILKLLFAARNQTPSLDSKHALSAHIDPIDSSSSNKQPDTNEPLSSYKQKATFCSVVAALTTALLVWCIAGSLLLLAL
ncbi:hypothetical protein IWW36_001537 [Coemansia brasiliensis]|uniref:Endopeptidase S2P n=1 Tax=Coemansia brasiliensis TaxID=2650707 RepID=A0A9W8IF95_9FUNG|nr:hypothetical protein IWW36_001537 [Coemansia brasiliensis]